MAMLLQKAPASPTAGWGTQQRSTPRCCASHVPAATASLSRREAFEAGLAASAALALSALTGAPAARALPAGKAQTPEVSSTLPEDGFGLYRYTPPKNKTPALRAGTIDLSQAYSFSLPGSFREKTIANILTGNFCLPRCDEPWWEAKYSGDEGQALLIVSPLRKLISKRDASVKDIGEPRTVLNSVGSYITGTTLEEEDVVSTSSTDRDGRPYYLFETNALAATIGPHSLTSCTAKGDLLYLFIVSATDKQFAKSKGVLRKVAESFRA